jgi:hypothetical protein
MPAVSRWWQRLSQSCDVFHVLPPRLAFVPGLYGAWCLAAGLNWRRVRARIGTRSARAVAFGVLFAPGLLPIVREAWIVAPAILACAHLLTVAAIMPSNIGAVLVSEVTVDVVSIAGFAIVYACIAHSGRARGHA